ncbi:hypothetical protein HY480_03805 [Candidatus Uhrbacteria bacterium]|nr:hypothetical protein [Candidatus Uhrbacteria bacterium]
MARSSARGRRTIPRPKVLAPVADDALDAAIATAESLAAKAAAAVGTRVTAVRRVGATFERNERAATDAHTSVARVHAELASEFDRMRAMCKVAHVKITRTTLTVTTRALEIVEDGVRYDIGAYRIRIQRERRENAFGEDDQVRIHALHRRRLDGWSHPHISSWGWVCLGNIEKPLRVALRKCEYDVALQLIIAVLESGTPRSERGDSGYHDRLVSIGRLVTRSRRNPKERSHAR